MRDVARGEKAVAAGLKVGRGLGGWELAQLNWSKLFKRGLLLKKSIIALSPEKRRSLPPPTVPRLWKTKPEFPLP